MALTRGLVVVLVVGLAVGLIYGRELGFLFGLVFGLRAGLLNTPWGGFAIARVWLALCRRLPLNRPGIPGGSDS